MKTFFLLPLVAAAFCSCDRLLSEAPQPQGWLRLKFDSASTRSGAEIPDSNAFLIEVKNSAGKNFYSGAYSDLPDSLALPAGEYSVSARSRDFSEPLFDAPQYGDSRDFTISPETITGVHLNCSLLNAGIRLQASRAFIAEYEGGIFYVGSASGTLAYGYGESRTGYFKPGPVWVEFAFSGSTRTLFTREVSAREQLLLRIDSGGVRSVSPDAEAYGEGISIGTDTSCTYTYEDFSFNGEGGDAGGSFGDDLSGALSIGQAREAAAREPKGVWVYGYIAGGDCTSTGCSFSAPFKSATNLLLAPGTSSVSKEDCLAAQLPKGDIRLALNLADHPENLSHLLYVKGDLVPKYFGIPGIQNISDYRLK